MDQNARALREFVFRSELIRMPRVISATKKTDRLTAEFPAAAPDAAVPSILCGSAGYLFGSECS